MNEQAPTPLPTCPMAETCKGLMERPFSGVALVIPGLVFIALGILVFIEPRILAWVMASAFIFLGAIVLMMASFIRKIGTRFQAVHRPRSMERPMR